MDRQKFFAALRKRGSGVFGTKLTPGQVAGTEAILDACLRNDVSDRQHVANVLANVRRETGGRMAPVRETFADSDAQAISRLERAWRAGKLKWVKTPYWRDGAFGRGPIQLTHWDKYELFGKRLGLPLRQKPELALDPAIGADIAVIGMKEGLFTGRKLADYKFPAALDAAPKKNPRRIVNGQDGSDAEVAGFHRAFLAALEAGGFEEKAPPRPKDEPPAEPGDVYASKAMIEVVQEKLFALGYTEVGSRNEKTGKFDGIKGDMTDAAIMAFRKENGLPISAAIDGELLQALDTAPKRKLSPGRTDATDQEVRDKVPEAKTAWWNGLIGKVVALPGMAITAVLGVAENFGIAREKLEPIKEFLGEVPAYVWIGGAAGIALAIWINARRGQAASTEAFKSGARR